MGLRIDPRAGFGRRVFLAQVFATAAAVASPAAAEDSGRKLFNEVSQPPCSVCHTLKAAGAAGEIGPNLDELKPSVDRINRAVRQGVGIMPGYRETLSEEQITVLVRYVARAVGAQP